ncbi:conserved hypothetical protein [Sporisorium reilianum SRZ2]|uniref:Allergen n=1 Tax=Sporisorium reilianum (strain SRZ2) TaxID=999809 RepID=E7A227_SPORE|nr:conserved hypothetical protein [Sporisorium reilianum SRZ2]
MNTVKKVLSSRKSHSGDDSSDDGRLLSSTAPTSNPGSPVSRQKEFGSVGAAGAAAAGAGGLAAAGHHHNKNTTTTATTTGNTTSATKPSTTQKVENKVEHGLGRSADVHATDGSIRHKHGHDMNNSKHLDLSSGKVEQDVQHLAAVTHQTHQRHEVEEVQRQREHERHVHHIQHHVQPVLDSEHAAEKVHSKIHPVTRVHETHASTDKDAALLTSVAGKHQDQYVEAPLHRQVVDKGEIVNEQIHHHIHNVVQPIIQKDSHEYHRIQTTIPTHVVTHEAPIVHESTHHKPVSKDEFLSGGGSLTNKLRSVHEANLLNTGKCDRKVDGIAEKLERDLGIKSTLTPSVGATQPTTTTTTSAI